MTRRGFTLIEIMVSLMIFTIVSVAMLGIMLMASDIYRRGEAGRSANDEAVAVMAALDEDLGRIVPPVDGGWFYANLDSNSGDTTIAFKIARRDRSLITSDGSGDRAIVAWWLKPQVVNGVAQNILCRGEAPALLLDADPATDQDLATLRQIMGVDGQPAEVTSGCLHFGAYLASADGARDLSQEWLSEMNGAQTLPNDTASLNTTLDPLKFPAAIRITTVLTGGGRFAARGRLVRDISPSDTAIRIVGIPSLSTVPGSMVKISPPANPADGEWIGYRAYANGQLDCSGDSTADPLLGRGRRRSVAAAFPAQSLVEVGQSYSLVRILR